MKSSNTTFVLHLLTLLLLTLQLPGNAASSGGAIQPTVQHAVQPRWFQSPTTTKPGKLRQLGFVKRIKLFWESKKAKMRPTSEGEKASTLAKAALFLFIGSIGLSLLLSAVTTASAIISTIASITMLASLIIALIVIFGDENRKSKAIAKAILITWGVMIVLALLFFVLLIAVLSGW